MKAADFSPNRAARHFATKQNAITLGSISMLFLAIKRAPKDAFLSQKVQAKSAALVTLGSDARESSDSAPPCAHVCARARHFWLQNAKFLRPARVSVVAPESRHQSSRAKFDI